jgi:hypothetical protein
VNYKDFLNRIIDDGVDAAKADYRDRPDKLRGAVDGFRACREKTPLELGALLQCARMSTDVARRGLPHLYWQLRCYENEVEWVCNCVSVVLLDKQLPTIVPPTVRAFEKVKSVVGVQGGEL